MLRVDTVNVIWSEVLRPELLLSRVARVPANVVSAEFRVILVLMYSAGLLRLM